eukprot:903228-Prymnesium_polylepis.1
MSDSSCDAASARANTPESAADPRCCLAFRCICSIVRLQQSKNASPSSALAFMCLRQVVTRCSSVLRRLKRPRSAAK